MIIATEGINDYRITEFFIPIIKRELGIRGYNTVIETFPTHYSDIGSLVIKLTKGQDPRELSEYYWKALVTMNTADRYLTINRLSPILKKDDYCFIMHKYTTAFMAYTHLKKEFCHTIHKLEKGLPQPDHVLLFLDDLQTYKQDLFDKRFGEFVDADLAINAMSKIQDSYFEYLQDVAKEKHIKSAMWFSYKQDTDLTELIQQWAKKHIDILEDNYF